MSEDEHAAARPVDPNILAGKRRAPRRRCTLAVEVRGAGGRLYAARTLDVSRGGMLLEFTDPQVRAPSHQHELLGFAGRIGALFPTGMEVTFGDGAVRAHAKPVRLVTGAPGSGYLLGCRFRRPLEEVDCRLLGVELSGDETDDVPEITPPAHDSDPMTEARKASDELLRALEVAEREASAPKPAPAPFRAPTPATPTAPPAATATASPPVALPGAPVRLEEPVTGLLDQDFRELNHHEGAVHGGTGSPASPVWAPEGTVVAHLFPTSQLLVGPRFSGRALELRTRGVVVELAAPAGESDAMAWAAALGADVRAVFLREGRVIWETRARVQRHADATAGVVRVTLLAAAPPPAAARRAFGSVGVDAVGATAAEGA
jgi:hypothetical protein